MNAAAASALYPLLPKTKQKIFASEMRMDNVGRIT